MASVLASYYRTVTIIEKRSPPGSHRPEGPVPQGFHVHSLLAEGQQRLEELIPGMTTHLESRGSRRLNFGTDFRLVHYGNIRPSYTSDISVLLQTRPFLEQEIRGLVLKAENIRMLWDTRVTGLQFDAKSPRSVTGVRIADTSTEDEEIVTADLVIDASGRSSKTPDWLVQPGIERPSEQKVKINLCYTSRLYEQPSSRTSAWQGLIVYPRAPDQTRAGYVFPVEGNRWLVSLAGYGGYRAAADDEGFVDFARSLAVPDVYDAIRGAKAVSETRTIRFESQRWLRYDRLRQLPNQLIVIGDAFCSLDPLFGQGMALCAIEAAILKTCLDHDTGVTATGFSRRCQQLLGNRLRVPWLVTTSEAFRYPSTTGDRLLLSPLLRWYAGHVFELSASHVDVYDTFLKVMHMRCPLSRFFTPRICGNVLFKAVREILGGGAGQ